MMHGSPCLPMRGSVTAGCSASSAMNEFLNTVVGR
jgi:hypothetical protein